MYLNFRRVCNIDYEHWKQIFDIIYWCFPKMLVAPSEKTLVHLLSFVSLVMLKGRSFWESFIKKLQNRLSETETYTTRSTKKSSPAQSRPSPTKYNFVYGLHLVLPPFQNVVKISI